VGIVLTIGVIVGLFMFAMLGFLVLRTRRIINIGLVVALVLIGVIVVMSTVTFASEQGALKRARTRGSDQLQVLSAARILTLRSFSDENLNLIERGAASEFAPDFGRVETALTVSPALLGMAYVLDPIPQDYARYLAIHNQLAKLNGQGNYEGAVLVATTTEAQALQDLNGAFATQIETARQRLQTNASDARRALEAVAISCVLLTVLAVVAIWFGLRPRIREYQ
jgi:hypothetical protein